LVHFIRQGVDDSERSGGGTATDIRRCPLKKETPEKNAENAEFEHVRDLPEEHISRKSGLESRNTRKPEDHPRPEHGREELLRAHHDRLHAYL
jgi:hypothetical protein